MCRTSPPSWRRGATSVMGNARRQGRPASIFLSQIGALLSSNARSSDARSVPLPCAARGRICARLLHHKAISSLFHCHFWFSSTFLQHLNPSPIYKLQRVRPLLWVLCGWTRPRRTVVRTGSDGGGGAPGIGLYMSTDSGRRFAPRHEGSAPAAAAAAPVCGRVAPAVARL